MLQQKVTSLEKIADKPLEEFAEQTSRLLSDLTHEVSLFFHRGSNGQLRVHVQGVSRILEKPELKDIEKAHRLLKILEEKNFLNQWMDQTAPQNGLSITIGQENKPDVLRYCSVIWAHYPATNQDGSGAVAVITPLRVKYSRMVPIVTGLARIVSRLLDTEEESF